MRREILSSLRTIVIFAATGALVATGARVGIFRLYEDLGRHGLVYAALSPVLMIVLQDVYFYFTHRAMHHPALFRWMHLEHHRSRHTSPFTSYAFSPWEALVHAAFVPLFLLFVPAHPISVFAFLAYMVVRNVLGHVAIEVFPRGFLSGPLRWLSTTTTHHALHHQRPSTNFGLYFPHWDALMNTSDPLYEARFAAVTEGEHADVRRSAAAEVRSA